jgi:WD40 repeat protein
VTLYGLDGEVRQQLGAATGAVRDVVVAPDGTWAATVGAAGAIGLWDVDLTSGSWVARGQFVGHEGDVVDAEASADSRELVTLGYDDRVVVWDAGPEGGFGSPVLGMAGRRMTGPPQVVEPGQLLVAPTESVSLADAPGGTAPVEAVFFRPSTAEITGGVKVGPPSRDPRGQPGVSVSPDRHLVAVSTGATVEVLDARTLRVLSHYTPPPVETATGHPRAAFIGCLAWTLPPTRLVVCSDDEDENYIVAAVDPRTGRRVAGTALGIELHSMGTSRDGRLLAASGGPDPAAAVVVLDAGTLELKKYIPLPDGLQTTHVSFSPDGRRLALSGPDGLTVVDTMTKEVAPGPAPLRGDLAQAEWFSDSRTLAVVGKERSVFLYDVRRRDVSPLPLPASRQGAKASDAVHLVPGITDELVVLGGDQGGRRYPLDPDAWSARACAVAGRELTEAEWARYLPGRPWEPTCGDPG